MTTDIIKSAIIKQRTALSKVHGLAAQIEQALSEIATAEAKCSDIRQNDEGDVSKLAKALSEQTSILDIAKARLDRLKDAAETARKEAEALSYSTAPILNDAVTAVRGLYHDQRVKALVAEFKAWMSPATFTTSANWIKSTISAIASKDARCEVSPEIADFLNNPKSESHFVAVAAFLEERESVVGEAIRMVEKREEYLAGQRAQGRPTPLKMSELIDLNA